MLFSRNVSSLQVDLSIEIVGQQFSFLVINAYASLPGYSLVDVIAINTTEASYSYFAIEIQSEAQGLGSMLAYYPFNTQFAEHRVIGNIRAGEMLQDYFYNSQALASFIFTKTIFLTLHPHNQLPHHTHHTEQQQRQQKV